MGLLDDAIREHLELKRRSGADPDVVARLEEEAFSASGPAAMPPAPEESAHEVEDSVAEHEPEALEPQDEREPEAEPESEPHVEQATQQFSLEESEAVELSAGHGPTLFDAEDELEQAPDFLEETPEHERLWFDQKPPKDFDF
ncbi:unannotated protein [freshwater metagenome]|uniref:Unannotated protein n=1 Tax=freshwater metagenome TaxID=449393 RepID=A0A6J7HAF6_9ZZZZ|nr:hypothetical protein [Actinomycetota bacterium]